MYLLQLAVTQQQQFDDACAAVTTQSPATTQATQGPTTQGPATTDDDTANFTSNHIMYMQQIFVLFIIIINCLGYDIYIHIPTQ